jgi:hypothetical protein
VQIPQKSRSVLLRTYIVMLAALMGIMQAFVAPAPALGDEPEAGVEVPRPEPGEDLASDTIYGWIAPPVEVQLAEDDTEVPDGMGAIFVPYMSEPADESEYVIFRGRQRVEAGSPGARLIVRPGVYRVELGSGYARDVMLTVKVNIGATVVVPVTWGGLRVEVVDRANIPHRAGYEVIRVADRDIFGVGYGADVLSGERVRTWILSEGLYRIVQPGASYRARSNYATVYVPPGGLVRYRLVIDPETGDFLGAGVVTPDEVGGRIGDTRFTPNLLIGINGNVRVDDDVAAMAELTVDGGVTFRDDPHTVVALLQIEEGVQWINPEVGDALPIQKSDDRIRLDLLYSYDLTPAFGPYARAGVEAAVFPTTVTTTETIAVRFTELDGDVRTPTILGGTAFRTADHGGRVRVFQGAGLNGRPVRRDSADLKIGAGVGLRQTLYNRYFAEEPIPDSEPEPRPDRAYIEIDDQFEEGLEFLMTGRFRLAPPVRLTTNLELFSDFSAVLDPTFEWENTLSIRILEVLSLDYVFELYREPIEDPATQLAHELLLRFTWEVL